MKRLAATLFVLALVCMVGGTASLLFLPRIPPPYIPTVDVIRIIKDLGYKEMVLEVDRNGPKTTIRVSELDPQTYTEFYKRLKEIDSSQDRRGLWGGLAGGILLVALAIAVYVLPWLLSGSPKEAQKNLLQKKLWR